MSKIFKIIELFDFKYEDILYFMLVLNIVIWIFILFII